MAFIEGTLTITGYNQKMRLEVSKTTSTVALDALVECLKTTQGKENILDYGPGTVRQLIGAIEAVIEGIKEEPSHD